MFVFDVDNTLTKRREQISTEMADLLFHVSKLAPIVITTGAGRERITRQLNPVLPLISEIHTNYCVEWFALKNDIRTLEQEVYAHIAEYSYSISEHKCTISTVSDIDWRQRIVRDYKQLFPDTNFFVSGRRSIDILPSGVTKHSFLDTTDIVYFGDEFYEFGNDTTVRADKVFKVKNPTETEQILRDMI